MIDCLTNGITKKLNQQQALLLTGIHQYVWEERSHSGDPIALEGSQLTKSASIFDWQGWEWRGGGGLEDLGMNPRGRKGGWCVQNGGERHCIMKARKELVGNEGFADTT